ncbi:hypothetical protein EDC04DRAFT_2603681 [Pisolithus marmoratus]|nr:hypothetical protein EDC04DRAFT_2603681 [Pisolithus marmoratus]
MDAGAWVLILSLVGMVGLNLACANIMIIADTLWLALEDEQLHGHIYQYPQQKHVHFYWLVVWGTPDVFLNNIAFNKGNLHKAFTGLDDKSKAMFTGTTPDMDDSDGEDEDGVKHEEIEMDLDPPQLRNKKGRKKAWDKHNKVPATPLQPATKHADQISPPSAGHAPTQEINYCCPSAASDISGDIPPANNITLTLWSADTDPLFLQMLNDVNWQKDDKELEQLSQLQLLGDTTSSDNDADSIRAPPSPLTPPPPTPHEVGDITHGVTPCHNQAVVGQLSTCEEQELNMHSNPLLLIPFMPAFQNRQIIIHQPIRAARLLSDSGHNLAEQSDYKLLKT